MDEKALTRVIKDLEIIQIIMMTERKDYHGIVPHGQHDDIDEIQTVIEIIKNLIIEPSYIWHK